MKHIAWDYGMINSAIMQVTGVAPKQQTVKTLCGSRVKSNRIDNDAPDCERCKRILRETEDAAKSVAK